MSVPSEPSSPQSSTRTRSPSPDDILERVAADVKEYERENVDTFEASVKAKHNLMTVEQNNGKLDFCFCCDRAFLWILGSVTSWERFFWNGETERDWEYYSVTYSK